MPQIDLKPNIKPLRKDDSSRDSGYGRFLREYKLDGRPSS